MGFFKRALEAGIHYYEFKWKHSATIQIIKSGVPTFILVYYYMESRHWHPGLLRTHMYNLPSRDRNTASWQHFSILLDQAADK